MTPSLNPSNFVFAALRDSTAEVLVNVSPAGELKDSTRAATFTVSPIAVYSCLRGDPTLPTIASPVLMPIPTLKSDQPAC